MGENKQEAIELLTEKFREIELICIKHKMPCFLTFAIEGEGKTEYKHTTVTPHLVGVKLTENKIDKFNAALNSNITLNLNTHKPTEFIGDVFDEFAGAEEDI